METFGRRIPMREINCPEAICLRGCDQIKWLLCAAFLVAFRMSAQTNVPQHVEVPLTDDAFHPDDHRQIQMSFGSTQATFTGTSPVRLDVERNGTRTSILLHRDIVQVNQARLYGPNQIVIAGMVDGDVSTVVIVDLSQKNIVDLFLCYSPAISPDGRFVAFVKFYPAHGISSAESHYMLYDLASSPAKNRPAGGKVDPASVGRGIFPPGVGNAAGDNVDVGDRPTHNIASDTFFWNEQSTEVVFVDQLATQYSAVVVRVHTDPPNVLATQLPSKLICPAGASPCYERLVGVKFPNSAIGPLEMTFRGVMGTPARPTKLTLTGASLEKVSAS